MRWKWIFGFLLILLILLPTAAYLTLSRYDFNNLKPRVAQAVQEATGRELLLTGDVKIRFGLTPALTIEDVALENAPWGSRPRMASMERLVLQVAILPLLRGTVQIKRLVLEAPDILIETSKSGRLNVDFEVVKEDGPEETGPLKETDSSYPPFSFVFNHVRIERGNLTYINHASDRRLQLALREATAVMGAEGPVTLTLNGAYNQDPCELKATVGGLAALADAETSWPVDLSLKLGGTTLSAEGTVRDVFNAKEIALAVKGKGAEMWTSPSMA